MTFLAEALNYWLSLFLYMLQFPALILVYARYVLSTKNLRNPGPLSYFFNEVLFSGLSL